MLLLVLLIENVLEDWNEGGGRRTKERRGIPPDVSLRHRSQEWSVVVWIGELTKRPPTVPELDQAVMDGIRG